MTTITLFEALLFIVSAGSIAGLSYWLGSKNGFDKGWDGCMRIVGKDLKK